MSKTSVYDLAKDFAEMTSQSVFLTGKAGTGKTTFLKKLRQSTKKQMVVTAPTGVAAINAEGVTMHSFFLLPFTPFVPTPEGRTNLIAKQRMTSSKRAMMRELELLVIDEISMVRADTLDAVDTVLRHYRYRPNEPFGGVQTIFIGDMYQLSPVARNEEHQLLSAYYKSPYFFHSRVIGEQPPIYIELDKIFRQQDPVFIRLLNEIRNNCLSFESRMLLNTRYMPDMETFDKTKYITLTTHNRKANAINANEMARIAEKTYSFKAKVHGDFPEKNYPNEETLELKKGARVIFIANDNGMPRRYYNGKIGTVSDINEEQIYVRCDGEDDDLPVIPETWENISYTVDAKTKKIEEKTLGTYTQYPLRQAWAITIHKSQGLTFDHAIIDLENAFASGQVYVAMSRCRSLGGIVLSSPIHAASLAVNETILNYAKQKQSKDELIHILEQSKEKYFQKIVSALFDLGGICGEWQRLDKLVSQNASSFNAESIPYQKTVGSKMNQMQSVAVRFRQQLAQLFVSADKEHITKRISLAAKYFSEQLIEICEQITKSPALTDNREFAIEYNNTVKNLYSDCSLKQFLIQGIKNDLSVENYFVLRQKFKLQPINIDIYALSDSANKITTKHPQLYQRLRVLRNELSESFNEPIYMVASTKSLCEITDYLPQKLKELESISGFGTKKIKKYGAYFLSVVVDFCRENQLSSLIDQKPRKNKKTNTKELSLSLYRSGKNIEEIAAERTLKKTTIEQHLAYYIAEGELPISDFLPSDLVDSIKQALNYGETASQIVENSNNIITFAQIRFVQASVAYEKKSV